MSYFPFISGNSLNSSTKIPFMGKASMLSVVECLRAMSFAMHASSKLRDLNYDSLCIEIVLCILTTFNGDVLFKLPPFNSPNSHSSQMQGMNKKHDSHAWYKVKMTNIKDNFNLKFWKAHYLGHLQCWNDAYDFFFLTNVKMK